MSKILIDLNIAIETTTTVGSVTNLDLGSIRVLGTTTSVLKMLTGLFPLLPIFRLLIYLVTTTIFLVIASKVKKLYNCDKAMFRISISLCCHVSATLGILSMISNPLQGASQEELQFLQEEFPFEFLLVSPVQHMGAVFFVLYAVQLGIKFGNSKFAIGSIICLVADFFPPNHYRWLVETIGDLFILGAFLSAKSTNVSNHYPGEEFLPIPESDIESVAE
ncbi:hypothetical protein P9112_012811 [Eukaryota sp. TZLM1-RC]